MASRVQLALNVDDVDEAVAFYTKLFQTEPAKRQPGYANFAIADPPLKLVLIQNPGASGRLNHLGVEVFDQADVVAAHDRLVADGLEAANEDGVTCCYAVQDKVWVSDPDGAPWEVYTVLEHAEDMGTAGNAIPVGASSGPCAAQGDACCTNP
ncbi:MAG TPA: ArsI/CadI family heavy metal resistance metalloenzyme [Chloroflexota bacterium]